MGEKHFSAHESKMVYANGVEPIAGVNLGSLNDTKFDAML